LLTLLLIASARAGTETSVLQERLGLDWKQELVTWRFAPAAGAAIPSPFA